MTRAARASRCARTMVYTPIIAHPCNSETPRRRYVELAKRVFFFYVTKWDRSRARLRLREASGSQHAARPDTIHSTRFLLDRGTLEMDHLRTPASSVTSQAVMGAFTAQVTRSTAIIIQQSGIRRSLAEKPIKSDPIKSRVMRRKEDTENIHPVQGTKFEGPK